MGPAYLFALVVGFGILLVQALMGSKDTDGDAHADADAHGELEAEGGELHAEADGDVDHDVSHDVDHDVSHDVDHDLQHDVDHDLHHDVGHDLHHDVGHDLHHDVGGHKELAHGADGQAGKDLSVVGGLAALLLSTRFWIFAFLGFGLSGTLLHYVFGTVSAVTTAVTAVIAGLASGLGVSLAFRALRKTTSKTATNTTTAVGKVARVLVPITKEGIGQVRIQLDGQTVDLAAKTSELRIERGDSVVIEEVDGDVAQVSKAPPEIGQ